MHKPTVAAAGMVFALVAADAVHAAHHFTKLVEVFPGATVAPNAQYIVLQAYVADQTVTIGTSVVVYNAAGAELGTFSFTGNVANGADQGKRLIATSAASTFFAVTRDVTMNPVLPAAGGKVCFVSPGFGVIDCVAWGNYTGTPAGVGTPFSASVGLFPPGRAAIRRLDIAGSPGTLDGGDDTNDSANNFRFGNPSPRNNAGQAGTIPPSTCGNNVIEGLESCDGGNNIGGDGCSAICVMEICGNSVTEGPEQCDDGNLADGDGCTSMCVIELPPLILANGFEDPAPP